MVCCRWIERTSGRTTRTRARARGARALRVHGRAPTRRWYHLWRHQKELGATDGLVPEVFQRARPLLWSRVAVVSHDAEVQLPEDGVGQVENSFEAAKNDDLKLGLNWRASDLRREVKRRQVRSRSQSRMKRGIA